MAFGKILFAVDGSSHMRAAAYSVARLARATGSEVILLHVTEEEGWMPPTTATAASPSARMRLLADLIANARVQTTLQIKVAPADETAETICAVAKELGVDLLALGSRGLSDLSGLFRGSVSHQVIARSDCPVLVIRCGVRAPGGAIRRILLAIAGGEDVPHGLEAAMTIARATDAEVLVLHARYLVTGLDSWPYVEPDEYAERTVVKVVHRLRSAGIRAASRSSVAAIARESAREAQDWDADLVVVGSRRLSELTSLLLGVIDHDVIQPGDRPGLVAGPSASLIRELTRTG
jgi:nucleotide-binding universal stress UspA family protein